MLKIIYKMHIGAKRQSEPSLKPQSAKTNKTKQKLVNIEKFF